MGEMQQHRWKEKDGGGVSEKMAKIAVRSFDFAASKSFDKYKMFKIERHRLHIIP